MALDTFDPNVKQKNPDVSDGGVDVAEEVIATFPTVARVGRYDDLIGLALRVRYLIGLPEGKGAYDTVKADIEARVQAGAKKYGRRLETNNGRDVLVDLYQELLDAINYFKQAQLEGRLR